MFQSKDKDGLMEWAREQEIADMGEWSVRQLRERGRELGVPYCSRLNKVTLLSEIIQYEADQRRKAESDQENHGATLEAGEVFA